MPLSKYLLVSSFLLLLSTASFAANNAQLSKQRTLFQQAQKALKANQLGQFKKLNTQLQGYPLHPYSEYLYLRHQLNQTDDNTLSQFITQNQGTFYANRLHNSLLSRLASKKKWSLYLQNYKESSSASQQCYRLQALLATGDKEQALIDTPALWLVPKSQHKACDPAFKYWQSQGLLTDELRWQRINLSLHKNQFSLAKYLAKSLKNSAEATKLISLWQKAHHSPQSLLNSLPAKSSSPLIKDTSLTREIIQHAVERLARKSTDKAHKLWSQLQTAYNFSEQDKLTTQRYIANRAALSREDRTLEFFGNIPAEPWRVRAALWQQDWNAAQKAILDLNLDQQQESKWQYWLARSYSELGDAQTAETIYQTLSTDRDFYSFLAADKLHQPYQMNHNPIVFEQSEFDAFVQRPAVARLTEFYTLKMGLESRRQAYALKSRYSPHELQLLATLTHQWGWHNQTIALLGKAKYWDALDLRFPVVFNAAIEKAAKETKLNPSWLLGVARQESAFNPHARSRVGASGLMQLMPKTATLIARLIKKPLKRQSELLDPSRNIQLGSAYLRKMFDEKQHNAVLATASYNAGPHRISRWLPQQQLPADIWMENIPFNETRKYTKRVLSYSAIFDYQRKQKIKPLSDRMPMVQPKNP